MTQRELFIVQVLFYGAFPLLFSVFARPMRLLLLYVYIAVVLTMGGFLGSVYALQVADGIAISAGSILYATLILTSLILVVDGRDASVVRNVVKIVIGVNVFKAGLFALTAYALQQPDALNRFDTSAAVFEVSLRVVLAGGLLILAELVLIILVFEQVKNRIQSPALLALTYVAFYVGVLCLDGLLFPLAALPWSDQLDQVIVAGVQGKLVLGLAFSVPLLVFMTAFRRKLAAFRAVSLRLQDLFFAPQDELRLEVERQQRDLEAGAERYRQLIESTADAVIGASAAGEVVSWNPSAAQLYGRTAEQAVGSELALLLPSLTASAVQDVLRQVQAGRTITDLETRVERPDGTVVEVSLTISPVRDGAGEVVGISAIGRDTSERHRMQRALEHQALHDALTGLPNRALFVDRLEHALAVAERSSDTVAVLFLDLDQFKMVNDASGHQVGDQLLVLVAERLCAAVRPGDTVARFGGDEFVLLCEQADAETAGDVADRVLESLGEPFELSTARLYATASLGVAVSPPADATTLLRQADAAMYEAKSRGRGRVQRFDMSMSTRVEGRLALVNDLREALRAGDLQLHYQPIVELSSGRLMAVEALARWHHPVRGWVGPDAFVPLAEETGLIGVLDRWALGTACRDAARALDSGLLPPGGYVAVNLSAHDIGQARMEEFVVEAVQAAGAGFSFDELAVEVTESVLMADTERSKRGLQALRDLGVRIAIDDFGTGYSSLAYLRRFPATHLKIDRGFISGIAHSSEDLAIVTSVVQLAAAVGLDTIAEGVETPEQRDLLMAMGCRAAQGWLWSPALPYDELPPWAAGRPVATDLG